MTPAEFNVILKARLVKMEKVLSTKEKEYSTGKSRFHNFEVAARMEGNTREKALWGMLLKHLVSVRDMIDNVVINPESITQEIIDEKIGDCMNYFALLEGMFTENLEKI